MKRTFDELENISHRTRSKKPRLIEGLKYTPKKLEWISATKTHNYMNKDPLIDWLKLYGKRERSFSNDNMEYNETFTNFLMKKGVEFERKVISYLKEKFEVKSVSDFYTKDTARETLQLIKEGFPIIHSAPLWNQYNKTYGIIDLVVRSDYVNKLVNHNVLTPEEEKKGCKFHDNFHYVVIDIKYHTLQLASDGVHMRNSGRIPAYKSQLYIYNEIISNIQKYKPNCAYILGRRWYYTSCNQKYMNDSCVDKLGVINFKEYDKHIPNLSRKAVKWYRNVLKNGVNWHLNPPTHENLYPNMSVDSGNWNSYKEKLALKLSEITMIWQCGVKNRKKAFENNVFNWDDPRCDSNLLGVGNSRKKIVDAILEVNRQNVEKILPKKIKNNFLEWKNEEKNEMFIDFETFSDLCENFEEMPIQKRFNIIYMIGVGWKEQGTWKYRSFICKDISQKSEYDNMNNFMEFYKEKGSPSLYYWCAEKNFWNRSLNVQSKNNNVSHLQLNKWKDLHKLFVYKEEPIVIKDCFGFGLKNIVKNMKKYGMIKTQLDSECKNGMMAMVKAWNCYTNFTNPVGSAVMKDIEQYNEFDCKSIFDILTYLRSNHK